MSSTIRTIPATIHAHLPAYGLVGVQLKNANEPSPYGTIATCTTEIAQQVLARLGVLCDVTLESVTDPTGHVVMHITAIARAE